MKIFKNTYQLDRIEIGFIILIIAAIGAVGWFAWRLNDRPTGINSFADCVAAGNPVMESYPEQCIANGNTFVNTDQEKRVTQTDSEHIPLSELPAGLRTVVKQARIQICTGDITGVEAELDAKTAATKGTFIDGKFAQVYIECPDKGSNSLFVFENDTWVFVAATDEIYRCSDLVRHNIPRTYIARCDDPDAGGLINNPVAS